MGKKPLMTGTAKEKERVMAMFGYMSGYFGQAMRLHNNLLPGVSHADASAAYHRLHDDDRLPRSAGLLLKAFDEWLINHVVQEERTRVQNSIVARARRAAGNAGVTVTLSEKAHRMLTDLAEIDGVTLSDVVERRLARQYKDASNRF